MEAENTDARRAAAALLGSIRSEAKAAASRANGAKNAAGGPGRTPAALWGIRCTCGAGEVVDGHRWSCPRGQAVKRRRAQGRDVLTGELEGAAK